MHHNPNRLRQTGFPLPSEVTFDTLGDWSEHPQEGIRYYSGIATYRKTFDLTPSGYPEENKLEIQIANCWINRLIGDEDHPEQPYTYTTHRFYKAGDALVPSGLIGKVVICN